MDDEDEGVWVEGSFKTNPPTLNHKLKNFELDALRCPCCGDFYNIAVTLRPCHHSFCSHCIRNSLSTRNGVKDKQECPVCRGKLEITKEMNGKVIVVKKLSVDEAIIPNHGLQVSHIIALLRMMINV